MTRPGPISSERQIVDAMIVLARAAKSSRTIVADSHRSDLFVELHRRGYSHVTTTRACRIPRSQHDVALVVWREPSNTALEKTLAQLVQFLNAAGVLVVWIGPAQRMPHRTLNLMLQRLGFRTESVLGARTVRPFRRDVLS
jgi:hypothetical protein